MDRLPIIVLATFMFVGVSRVEAQERTPIQATDVLKIRQLGEVRVSPDHQNVAYTVKRAVRSTDSTYAYRTHLWVASASGRRPPHPLTRGDRSASQPDWHPSGDRLAFVRDVDGTPQIFVLPFYGGEAYQLTSHRHGATNPRWSPSGERILFTAQLPHRAVRRAMQEAPPWTDERPGRSPVRSDAEADPDGSLSEARAWLSRNRQQSNPRVFNRLDLQGERDLAQRPHYQHLFVQEADPDAEPRDLTPGFYSFGNGEWLPNGTQIVSSSALDARRHPDRVRDRDLFLVDVADASRNRLLDMDGYATFAPRVSPDGQHVAFLARRLDDVGYAQTELGRYAFNGRSAPQLLTKDFDRSVRHPRWNPDSWHLYFTAPSKGGFPLYRLAAFGEPPTPQADTLAARAAMLDTLTADTLGSANTRSPLDSLTARPGSLAPSDSARPDLPLRQLTTDTTGVHSFSVAAGGISYVRTQVTNPYELYTANSRGVAPRRLTSHNADWLENRVLSRMTPHTLQYSDSQRNDTLQIDYWTMKPTDFREGRSYPMLLEIHGGPMAMWGPGEASMWHEFQFLAGKGYGVAFANPRGSGGYGQAFKRANYRDWGAGPAADVLAAADSAAALSWLDADRQVVTGGSYAGYLTTWLVGHTNRFRAAIAQRGVYDLTAFLGEGNAWRLVPSHFGGYPWGADTSSYAGEITRMPAPDDSLTAQEVLSQNSPLSYVDQIQTPLLIMHSDEDLRTGVSQSEMLYKALKILDRPVEYVRYPNAGHDLSRTGHPRQRIDRLLRIWEFFERYVDHRAPTTSAQR